MATARKSITFQPENYYDKTFEVQVISNVVCLSNRENDLKNILIEIGMDDWNEIVNFVNQNKEQNS